jgi:oligo-1,6-glucosidase
MQKSWWKEAVIYQIYPRSFKDANADGIGDLQGIISKLDYLKDLGIDVIWLSPHFKSPNVDNGYDISDYEAIMSDFGTMEDFDEMLAKIHQNGMKLIIDLVVNHSSDEHFWFQEARKGKENPYRDYYIWKKSDTPPNDWISFFSGSAWEFDELSKEYYLHYFVKKQPDLNWENPKLRQEIYKMMHFWLEKGVNGFRMDVISLISKDQNFPNFPENRFGDLSYYANGPRVHEFLQEMNQEVLIKYDCMTVGEAFGVSAEQANDYVGKERNELNMIYHFDHAVPRDEICFVEPKAEFKLAELKAIFKKWDKAIENNGWNTVYFGNHDNARMLSRFGDTGIYHQESAKMLATVLLTLRGTPYLYQGDEIGMYNCTFEDISEFNDVQVLNAYKTLVESGDYSPKQFLEASNKIARDHARTPMQWNAESNAGFSDAEKTWLKINHNYFSVNALSQSLDENSVLNFYKKLIQIRKQTPALIYGDYLDLRPRCNRIWLYLRTFEENSYLIMNNFTNKKQSFEVKQKFIQKELILANVPVENDDSNQVFVLKPYESRIYRIDYQ